MRTWHECAPCWPAFWLCKTHTSPCIQYRCEHYYVLNHCLSLLSRNHQTAATPLWRMKMWKVRYIIAADERSEYFLWTWIITWHFCWIYVIVFRCSQSVKNLCDHKYHKRRTCHFFETPEALKTSVWQSDSTLKQRRFGRLPFSRACWFSALFMVDCDKLCNYPEVAHVENSPCSKSCCWHNCCEPVFMKLGTV